MPARASRWPSLAPWLAGALLAASCMILGSRDYTAIDGSTRCVAVLSSPAPFIHGNNHMLYPLHVRGFHGLLGRLGLGSPDAFTYFHRTTAVNALAGGAALAVLILILTRLTGDPWLSLAGGGLIGSSHCFLLLAANPSEPMVGFLGSVLAVACAWVALDRDRLPGSIAAGLLLTHATASYQSMICVFPVLLVMYAWAFRRPGGRARAAVHLGVFLASMALGFGLIYGVCYREFHRIDTASGMVRRFLQIDGTCSGAFGRWRLASVPAMGFGLVLAFFKLPYAGIRATFLRGTLPPEAWAAWIAAGLLAALTAVAAVRAWLSLRQRDPAAFRTAAVLLLCFAFPALGPLYWEVAYPKLWLQSMAGAVLFAAYSLSRSVRAGAAPAWGPRALGAAFLAALLWNGSHVLLAQHRGRPDLAAAAAAMDRVIGSDALVLYDWDEVSEIFATFHQGSRRILSVPTLACELGEARLLDRLDRAIAQARDEGRPVYAIGILGQTPATWERFLGVRIGIGYAALQKYRDRCRLLWRGAAGGREYVLHKLE